MTVSALPSTVSYIEDGATTVFPAPFRFRAASDLVVERILADGSVVTLALSVDYTVTGGSTDAGGTVTRAAATSGATLRIRRDTARAQPMIYTSGDRFPAKSHEEALDRQMLISQEQDDLAADLNSRALKAKPGQTLQPVDIDAFVGQFFTGGLDGQLVPSAGTGADIGLRIDLLSSAAGATLINFLMATGAVAQDLRTALRLGLPLMPEHFGAVGDGVANDHPAFAALSAEARARGGGVIALRPGRTYRVGGQAAGSGYYRFGAAALDFDASCKSITIEGNGATLKFIDGMKYGAFNAGTGAATDFGLPYTVTANAATAGVLIQCRGVKKVAIRNVNLDGNSAGFVIGGRWSADSGRQLVCYGVYLENWDVADLLNCNATNFLLDCYCFNWPGLTLSASPKPLTMMNCTGSYAGRDVVSNLGGNSTRTFNCKFSFAGEAPATVTVPAPAALVSSSPASCWNNEEEGGSKIRNVQHLGTSFVRGANTATAYLAASGDVATVTIGSGCELVGAVWLDKPGCRIESARVFGNIIKLKAGSADPNANSSIVNSLISDLVPDAFGALSGLLMSGTDYGTGWVMRGCQIVCSTTSLNLRSAAELDAEIHWSTGTATLADTNIGILCSGSKRSRLRIIDEIVSGIPPIGYAVESPDERGRCEIVSAGGKLKWISGTTGYAGVLQNFRNAAYNPASIAAGATLAEDCVFTVPVSQAGAMLQAFFAGANAANVAMRAEALTTTTGKIYFHNTTAAPVDLPAGELRVMEVA